MNIVAFLSLLLNVVLFKSAQNAYTAELGVRLKPLGPSGFIIPRPMPGSDLRIAMLGDSRAEQWHPTFPTGLEVNLGASGQTSAQVRARVFSNMRSARSDVTVLQVGINDLKAIPFFPGVEASIQDELIENLRAIVSQIEQSGSPVIVTTIIPPGPPDCWITYAPQAKWTKPCAT